MDGRDSVGNVWTVPQMQSSDIGSMKVEEEREGKDEWKMRHREASVLRYKEKRRNRLFSKRIRYEVRKLNAEKRPRMKVTLICLFPLIYYYSAAHEFLDLSNRMQCLHALCTTKHDGGPGS